MCVIKTNNNKAKHNKSQNKASQNSQRINKKVKFFITLTSEHIPYNAAEQTRTVHTHTHTGWVFQTSDMGASELSQQRHTDTLYAKTNGNGSSTHFLERERESTTLMRGK